MATWGRKADPVCAGYGVRSPAFTSSHDRKSDVARFAWHNDTTYRGPVAAETSFPNGGYHRCYYHFLPDGADPC